MHPIEFAARAIREAKRQSPDGYDLRDEAVIERECLKFATVAAEAMRENISYRQKIAVQNMLGGSVSEADANLAIKAALDAALNEAF